MNPLFEKLRIINGAAYDADCAAIVMVVDDLAFDTSQPHAIIYRLEDTVAHDIAAFPFSVVSARFAARKEDGVMVLGDWGEFRVIRQDETLEEQVPCTRGPMRRLAYVGDRFIAAGTDLQVFKRHTPDNWIDISPLEVLRTRFPGQHLESIDGFSPDELYAAGPFGVVWYYDGSQWTAVQCATNAGLFDVTCAEDGNVYVCGDFGTILKGRRDSFEVIHSNPDMIKLWGIAYHNGVVCASGFTATTKLVGDVLEPDNEAMMLGETFYDLDVKGGTLWSFGMKDLLKHDGEEWSAIIEVSVV